MNISYYTIDDLRLPPKRSLRKCLLPGSECWDSQTESMSWNW